MGFWGLLVDPSAPGRTSCSRLGLFLMNLCTVAAAAIMLYRMQDPTTLIVGVAGVNAGAYGLNSYGRSRDVRTAKPNPNATQGYPPYSGGNPLSAL